MKAVKGTGVPFAAGAAGLLGLLVLCWTAGMLQAQGVPRSGEALGAAGPAAGISASCRATGKKWHDTSDLMGVLQQNLSAEGFNAGRVSNRAKPRSLRCRVLRLIRKKYGGEPAQRFGPTLAAEHLAEEDGIGIGVETLRGWMLEEGLWRRERRGRAHRRRRERKAHFGELVQLDGSFHDWLEGRGPGGCLMNMVDGATGTMLCRMGEERRPSGRRWEC